MLLARTGNKKGRTAVRPHSLEAAF